IAAYNDDSKLYAVVGTVVDFPDRRDAYTNLRVEVEQIREADSIKHTRVEGLILAKAPPNTKWEYGDRVLLTGKLRKPPEDEQFSYQDYLARQGIYSYMPYVEAVHLPGRGGSPILKAVFRLRQKALDLVYRQYPDPEASLAAGILLGVESGISAKVKRAFQDTGTAHVIAISGFNVTIVIGLIIMLFSSLLGRGRGALLAGITVVVYTVLVGADAAVVRAAFMAGLTLLARQVGRRQDGLNSLAITAAVMAFFNPFVLGDVGFQLSFAATLGLVLYAEPFQDYFLRWAAPRWGEKRAAMWVKPVGEYFLFTLAAQVMTLPLIAYHFQRISLSSLPANILILPVQPPIMILGGISLLLGLALLPLGQLGAFLAWPFLAFTIRVVEWFSQFDQGVLVLGEIKLTGLVFVYALLLGFTFYWDPIKEWYSAEKKLVVRGGALAAAAFMLWQAALRAPDGRLHVTILDVGSGEAVLVQTPQGRSILINGGPSLTRLSEGLGRRLPLFHRRFDYLVVAAPREEYTAGLPGVVERFPPEAVLWAGPPNASRSARLLRQGLAQQGISIVPAEAGQRLDFGGGAVLEVLSVGRRGAVLLLSWENFRLLLPSGLDFPEMEAWDQGRQIGPLTALLLAESGYAPANPAEWIENLHPQLVLLSVAAGDYSGLPDAATLQALQGYTLLRTDEHGWIELTTDGQQLWVEVENK
ncbi:MAG: ComEC/Rec2 family competence protein, partial [Anaerolineae bacterium]|nr:ComEC/Rec2 family competence protein [Anaerolineae bacterium]